MGAAERIHEGGLPQRMENTTRQDARVPHTAGANGELWSTFLNSEHFFTINPVKFGRIAHRASNSAPNLEKRSEISLTKSPASA